MPLPSGFVGVMDFMVTVVAAVVGVGFSCGVFEFEEPLYCMLFFVGDLELELTEPVDCDTSVGDFLLDFCIGLVELDVIIAFN